MFCNVSSIALTCLHLARLAVKRKEIWGEDDIIILLQSHCGWEMLIINASVNHFQP